MLSYVYVILTVMIAVGVALAVYFALLDDDDDGGGKPGTPTPRSYAVFPI